MKESREKKGNAKQKHSSKNKFRPNKRRNLSLLLGNSFLTYKVNRLK